MATKEYRYDARLDRVIDGDTFVAVVDLGFDVSTKVHFRILNYDAPEMSKHDLAGQAGKEKLHAILKDQPLRIQSYKNRRSFIRWIAEVWVGTAETPLLVLLLT